MDLSANDLISKYYVPCEHQVKRVLQKICQSKTNVLLSYIDVASVDLFQDPLKTVIITDQFIEPNLYSNKRILKLPDSLYGIYYIPDPVIDRPITKNFNLFLNRASVQRQFWFYKIIQHNWLDECAISYIGSTNRTTRPDLDPVQYFDFIHENFFRPYFVEPYTKARDLLPYQNFQDPGDLRQIMVQSKLSVVIETYHERTDAISFSEKIFRALQVPRPWVFCGATGSINKLREMGFDVFDDYIDHGYNDHCTKSDTVVMDQAVLEQISQIRKLYVTDAIIADWQNRYQNNLSILASWKHRWRKDLQKFVCENFPDCISDHTL